jgi:hypothetical protein
MVAYIVEACRDLAARSSGQLLIDAAVAGLNALSRSQ